MRPAPHIGLSGPHPSTGGSDGPATIPILHASRIPAMALNSPY